MFLIWVAGPPVLLGIISVLLSFSYRGKEGMKALREKAERTGKLEDVEKVTRWGIILQFTFTFLVCGLMVAGVMWGVAAGGKQGVGMEWIRKHGLALTGAFLAALLVIPAVTRQIVRRALREDGAAIQEENRELRIKCMNNPKRFDGYMTGLVIQALMLIILVAMFRSPYMDNGFVVLASIIYIIITAVCVCGAVSESRNLFLLAEMNRAGIRYYTACPKGILIPWDSVETVQIYEKKIYLRMKADERGEKKPAAVVNLERSHYSDETLQYMVCSMAPGGLCKSL